MRYMHGSEGEKWRAVLLCCFVSVSVLAQRMDPNHQLLWQITGKGIKKPSYLFGSFHSNDSRLFRFTDSTYSALLHADAVVLEADIYSMFNQYDARVGGSELKFDGFGNPYTSDKKASKTQYGDEDGRPQFLDAYFQQVAYNSGKRFFALESIEDQLQIFDDISYRNYRELSLKSLSLSQENILQTYLRGDIDNMQQMLKSQLSISENAYNVLISNRNHIMANGIDTLCRKYGLFVAVGAGHLAGPDGIIGLLRAKGFTVRQVLASYAEKPTPAEIELRKYNQYHYVDPEHHFTALFGGKPKIDTSDTHFQLVYQEMGQGNTFWIEVETDSSPLGIESMLDDLFYVPEKSKIREVILPGGIKAFEGVTYIYDVGDCWRRVFIHRNQLFKLTCYGGNKFMNSDRPKKFFDKVTLD